MPTEDEGAYAVNDFITLAEASRASGTPDATIRRAMDKFGLTDRTADGRQRLLPTQVAELFAHSRRAFGYLYPRKIKNRDALLAEAERLASENRGPEPD